MYCMDLYCCGGFCGFRLDTYLLKNEKNERIGLSKVAYQKRHLAVKIIAADQSLVFSSIGPHFFY